ncbi:MAG: aldehyde dehydrogenase [Bacteroidales bacterium]|nr:aldehyde dehydrogenase [Bacteroidales bacterium]
MDTIFQAQKTFFATQQTKEIRFRIQNLQKLQSAILKYEPQLLDALWTDLHKSDREAYITEIAVVLAEITNHLRHLKRWAKPQRVFTPFFLYPGKSRILPEPLGVALIIAPWNYPVNLLLNPLVGAISSGCCAILKPSPYTPTVSQVLQQMIDETFPPQYMALVQGGRAVNTELLQLPFDFIFYTGSPAVGKVVMKAAAEHLTPVILELGGKSPCIVDHDADIQIAARRIAWGKIVNAGQTCIAPDYAFVHKSVKADFINQFKIEIENMLGPDIRESRYFARIVNDKAFHRITELMKQGTICYGGETDASQRYIAPTIIEDVKPDFPIMQEEIFGPILPVMEFETLDEPLNYVAAHEKPLAFYFFGNNQAAQRALQESTSGGACINDTIMHIANAKLPFGGVGNSGTGKYHGIHSFLIFSNLRSVLWNKTSPDFKMRYPPYHPFNFIKKSLK